MKTDSGMKQIQKFNQTGWIDKKYNLPSGQVGLKSSLPCSITTCHGQRLLQETWIRCSLEPRNSMDLSEVGTRPRLRPYNKCSTMQRDLPTILVIGIIILW